MEQNSKNMANEGIFPGGEFNDVPGSYPLKNGRYSGRHGTQPKLKKFMSQSMINSPDFQRRRMENTDGSMGRFQFRDFEHFQ